MIVREKKVIVRNLFGVHGRVATSLALVARQHDVRLHLVHGEETIDCSSVLDVLSMAFACGSALTVRVTGEEEMVERTFLDVERIFSPDEELRSSADVENE